MANDIDIGIGLSTTKALKDSKNLIKSLDDIIDRGEKIEKQTFSPSEKTETSINRIINANDKLGTKLQKLLSDQRALNNINDKSGISTERLARAQQTLATEIEKVRSVLDVTSKKEADLAAQRKKDAADAARAAKIVLDARFKEHKATVKSAEIMERINSKQQARDQQSLNRALEQGSSAANKYAASLRKVADSQDGISRQKDIGSSLGNNISKAGSAAHLSAGAFGLLAGKISPIPSLFRLLAGAVSVFAAIRLATTVININREMDGMNAALTLVTGSSEEAAEAFTFLSGTADKLGVNLRGVSKGYQQMQAAAMGANFSLTLSEEIFSSVTESSRAMNLSADDTAGTIRALTQIMSKGKVNEEFDEFPLAA